MTKKAAAATTAETCTFPGCPRPVRQKKTGLCNAHREQARKTSKLEPLLANGGAKGERRQLNIRVSVAAYRKLKKIAGKGSSPYQLGGSIVESWASQPPEYHEQWAGFLSGGA